VTGSRFGGLSSAMSQVSGGRGSALGGRGASVNIRGGTPSTFGLPFDPMAALGVPAWDDNLKELHDTREKLDASKKKKKKKKKKKGKGSGLLRTNTSYTDAQSEYMDDGCTSAYTS